MGNVQSESTQESTTKDGEEKANLDRKKPPWRPSGPKQEPRSRSPGPQAIHPKEAGQPPGKESGGADRQAGTVEVGKSNSKKSKLKLSSMWAQNLSSGGIKEASLCNKDPVTERRGLACFSRSDLPSGQSAGSILPGEQKCPKATLKPAPPGVAHDHGDLGTRKEAPKGKSKTENASLGLLPERSMELGSTAVVEEDVETKICCPQHTKTNPKEYAEHEGQLSSFMPSPRKQLESTMHCPAPLNVNEDTAGAPKSLSKKNITRMAPYVVPSLGRKKVLLACGTGEKDQEKEPTSQQDCAPGSDGDSKGPALASSLLVEPATTSSSPVEKPLASGSEGKGGGKTEAVGAEVVSSETMQELLDWGLNFLYKVTIQPGQWPPSIKAVSYADILKQCPPKRVAAGAPALSKALHHLTMAVKKLPTFKGLESSNPEDFSMLRQLFLEHLKEVAPKEPTDQVPGQQMVRFVEELSIANPKRREWQRPRPPTPYPQRRKGRSRKLPKFDAAGPQMVTFLGSNSKCDWLMHDDSQLLLDDPIVTVEGGDGDLLEQSSAGDQEAEEAGPPPSITSFLLEQKIAEEAEKSRQKSRRRPPGPEDGAKETLPLQPPPYSLTPDILSPLGTVWSSQTEDRPPMPTPAWKSHSPSEVLELSGPTGCTFCDPTGPALEQKAPAVMQARPKVRKQGPAASKSKEKLKSSGPPKMKAAKSRGQKQRPRGCGVTSPLRLERVPRFTPFEKVARPFYFGEPLVPFSQDKTATAREDVAPNQDGPDADLAVFCPAERCQWPAFQVTDSCARKCYCRHQEERKLPKNVVAWLNPSTNHLAEPPWVATALLAVSLVAGTKFCLDSYQRQHAAHED